MFAYFSQLEGADTGDFEAINAAAFLLSTESSKTIFIAVKDDDLPEADETFIFNLKLQVKTHWLPTSFNICVCATFPSQSGVCCIYVMMTPFLPHSLLSSLWSSKLFFLHKVPLF